MENTNSTPLPLYCKMVNQSYSLAFKKYNKLSLYYLQEKFLQFVWLRAGVFQLYLKYLLSCGFVSISSWLGLSLRARGQGFPLAKYECGPCRLLSSQGPEEMCLLLEHQNPSKTSEQMCYFDRVTEFCYTSCRPQTIRDWGLARSAYSIKYK